MHRCPTCATDFTTRADLLYVLHSQNPPYRRDCTRHNSTEIAQYYTWKINNTSWSEKSSKWIFWGLVWGGFVKVHRAIVNTHNCTKVEVQVTKDFLFDCIVFNEQATFCMFSKKGKISQLFMMGRYVWWAVPIGSDDEVNMYVR